MYRGDDPIEVSYSGGKDSDVILTLTKMAGIPYRAIYKNTTIDPPGTVKHCKDNGVEVVMPKERLFDIVARKGFPTRRARFCCEILKEYKILDNAVQGIRRSESVKRAKNYADNEPIICRNYSKIEHVNIYLPILDWSDKDVADFIKAHGIKCHPLYYNEDFNVYSHIYRKVMKQYLSSEQAFKLTELGFLPETRIKEVQVVHSKINVSHDCIFTIGKLIEMLPLTIKRYYDLSILSTSQGWWVLYGLIGDGDMWSIEYEVYRSELIDALYDMTIKLKEEGVI